MTDRQLTAEPIPAAPFLMEDPAPPCPLCGSGSTLTIHFPELAEPYPGCPPWPAHHKYHCPACQYLWSERFEQLDLAVYGRRYVEANADAQRIPNERMAASPRLLDRLLTWTQGQRFLEYGIGYNTPYVEEVRALGIDLWGCDISEAVPYGEHILKLPEKLAILQQEPFDAIFGQDVVEHFNDPAADYLRLRSLLKPGGLLLSSTPVLEKVWNGRPPVSRHIWLWTPWHTSVCSTNSMGLLAEQVQMEFVATLSVPADVGWAFLLRKPDEPDHHHVAPQRLSPRTVELRNKLRRYMADRDWP